MSVAPFFFFTKRMFSLVYFFCLFVFCLLLHYLKTTEYNFVQKDQLQICI